MVNKKIAGIIIIASLFFCQPAYAEGYWKNMGRNLVRGTTNMLSSPLEIPIAIQKYHESAGYPVLRHMEGMVDGSLNTIRRLGSGAWDFVVAAIPGDQEGIPVQPETLF